MAFLAIGTLGVGEGVVAEDGLTTAYQSLDADGAVQHVGITDDLAARAAAHAAEKGIAIEPIPGLEAISRADARAVEQTLIDHYGLPNLSLPPKNVSLAEWLK